MNYFNFGCLDKCWFYLHFWKTLLKSQICKLLLSLPGFFGNFWNCSITAAHIICQRSLYRHHPSLRNLAQMHPFFWLCRRFSFYWQLDPFSSDGFLLEAGVEAALSLLTLYSKDYPWALKMFKHHLLQMSSLSLFLLIYTFFF